MGVKQARERPDYQGDLGAPERKRQRGRTRSDVKSQTHVKEAETTLPAEKDPQSYLPHPLPRSGTACS